MNSNYQTQATLLIQQNKVLNQTYKLLALSLIPTVLGALVGIFFNLGVLFSGSPIFSTIIFLVGCFGLMYFIHQNKNNSKGIYFLLGFTLFMGVMLSQILQHALQIANGGKIIAMAGGCTAVAFFAMSAIGNNTNRNFSKLGQFLSVGLILLIVASIINIFLQLPVLHLALSVISIGIFSAYIIYDVNRIVKGGETNYVIATLSLYLNIYNLFVSLLNLLMALNKEN